MSPGGGWFLEQREAQGLPRGLTDAQRDMVAAILARAPKSLRPERRAS